jgi:hypothetical protein
MEGTKTPIIEGPPSLAIKTQSKQQPSRGVQTTPTPLPMPVPLETIWPPAEESPVQGGKRWVLLATIAGALTGFFLLCWAVTALLDKLL